jgi:predicted metal-dependent HD superfamily phosphohydrolase
MKLTTGLLHETALYIKNYYDTEFSADFTFHNYHRAVAIVRNCMTLGIQMNASKEQLRTLQLAAWFLETGFSKDYYNYHTASVAIANEYLESKGADDDLKKAVEEIILSTRIPEQPVTLLAQILCDARMYHAAEKNFLPAIENLRKEQQLVVKKEYSDKEWLAQNLDAVTNYFYFTAAAKELFEKKKRKQKSLLQKQPGDPENSPEEKSEYDPPAEEQEKLFATLPEEIKEDMKLERGVETFFRITERRHIELSAKAHDKASLLISVNAIVISIVLSVLVTRLEENKFLLLPTLLLVITCVTTIILAIISTRPRILKRTDKNILSEDHEFNILFFGDFSKLSLAAFKKAMKETYKNKNELYDSLSRDIYYQGMVLVWKYRYINIAYNVFMYGFVITILSFMIAFVIKTA